MLSSVDSPHADQAFCVKNPSAPYNASSAVIKEIRSSLFLATSIVENEVPDESASSIYGRCCKSTVHFQCGRLKYSHVKGEWSILHRLIRACEDGNQKSGSSKNPLAMVIASLRPVSAHKHSMSHNENTTKKVSWRSRSIKSPAENEHRQHCRNRKQLSHDQDGDDHFDTIHYGEVGCNVFESATTGCAQPPLLSRIHLGDQPISPPIELVRCLLNGAEFISMMQCARREVEFSMHKVKHENHINKKGVKEVKGENIDEKVSFCSEARFWSRRMTKNQKQLSINLQPMIVALAASTISGNPSSLRASPLSSLNIARTNDCNLDKTSLETVMLRFIDECIRFAHMHTLDLIAPWGSFWQVRANLRSVSVESIFVDENHSSSVKDPTPSTLCRFKSALFRKGNKNHGGNTTSYLKTSPFDKTTIHEFVRTCLAKPWDDKLQSSSMMTSSTRNLSSVRASRKGCSDISYHHMVVEASKRNINSRTRTKVRTREPADSLVATGLKQDQNITPSTKSILSHTRKKTMLEKKRQRRVKGGRHLSPSSSVLENTAKIDLQRNGWPSPTPTRRPHSDSVYKRKRTDTLSPLFPTHERKSMGGEDAVKEEYDAHVSGCHNEPESALEKEKISPNSLYEFFDRKKRNVQRARFSMCGSEAQIGDCTIHVKSFQQQESKDWHGSNTPGTRSPVDVMSNNALVQTGSKIEKTSVPFVANRTWIEGSRHENEKQQKITIDSLHRLSKSSVPVPASDASSNVLSSIGKQSLGKKTTRSLSHDTAANFSCVENKSQERKAITESSDESRDFSNNQNTASSTGHLRKDISNLKSDSKTQEVSTALPWVNLSHIGHISDYHGYKRKYEHFAPLQFGSVADIRSQIERTLGENKFDNDEESDEEVIEDYKDYERAIDQYATLAEKERFKRKKCENTIPQRFNMENFDDMVVVFSTPDVDNEIAPPATDSLTEKSNSAVIGVDNSPCSQPSTRFLFFDDEDDILSNTVKDKGETKRKRRSRSAHIAHQKKTSLLMLNQMLHSLDFIVKYNRKSKDTVQKPTANVESDEVTTQTTKVYVEKEDANDGNSNADSCASKFKSNEEQYNRKVQCGQCTSSFRNKIDFAEKPPLATLNLDSLKSYDTIRKKFSLLHSLNGKDDIEAMKNEIRNILGKAVVLDEFFRDKEIISEEKTLGRCIRGYSSKADQEKIEKRDFEEKQKLQQHEFQYYCRPRKKKKSSQEIEWEEISSRPIYYARDTVQPLLFVTDACKWNPNCKICASILYDEQSDNTIFSPKFRREKTSIMNLTTVAGSNEVSARSGISNFPSPMHGQKLAFMLNLSELYHTLDFIKDYNSGMLVSRKKRK